MDLKQKINLQKKLKEERDLIEQKLRWGVNPDGLLIKDITSSEK